MADNTYIREPFESELEFFRKNKGVGGMATEDGKVILNPFSSLSPAEKTSVALNESARLYLRKIGAPSFAITDIQKSKFKDYGSEDDIKSTIAARILTGDPSVSDATKDQIKYVNRFLKPYVRPPVAEAATATNMLAQTPAGAVTGRSLLTDKQILQQIRRTPWHKEFVEQYGEAPDLSTTDYDYLAAWRAGIRPQRDPFDQNRYHWSSSTPDGKMLKSEGHKTAWKEYFMRETGKNPDALGIATEDDAVRLLGRPLR